MVREWSSQLLAILHVRLRVEGAPPAGPVLLVSNHISWLDIFVLDAVCATRFVAKVEVRSWPVIGWLCARAGTLFIERERRHDTGRASRTMLAALEAGDAVAVYPEGTTTDGTWLRHFHTSLLQPAVATGAAVRPATIRYLEADGRIAVAPAYVDDLTIWDSLLNIVAMPEIHAVMTFLPPIPAAGKNRRELTRAAEEAIASALSLAAPRRPPGTPGGPPAAPR
ncbi:MAG: 1-acyl-sn-glycerol-3-phosphate acyltransferase [Betaproteobacteria bacterium]|nr:1-acyl-sn-glycerol-3-phosphate acyltransferase [Betaproteobacteria bacterium]